MQAVTWHQDEDRTGDAGGKVVRLEPIAERHVADLAKVGLEEEIWRYMRYGKMETIEQLTDWVRELLVLQEQGTDLPFAVIYKETGAAVGCTRYLNIDTLDRSLEIGGTWYGLDYQGTLVNTECKYLLMKHAFEVLGCVRVWFKTDSPQPALAASHRTIGGGQGRCAAQPHDPAGRIYQGFGGIQRAAKRVASGENETGSTAGSKMTRWSEVDPKLRLWFDDW